MNFTIRTCTLVDAHAYANHCLTHLKEKGIGGIYAHPFSENHVWDEEQFLKTLMQKWALPDFSPNWEIAWVAEVDGKMVGHLNLRCGGIPAAVHRMRLGMGIETPYRSMGIGTALLGSAITWAKNQKQISWIDLSVFAENHTAIKLYESFGFRKIFEIEDALRVNDVIITDNQMVLKL